MIPAYSELYLSDAKENLAAAFDYAVYDCRLDGDWFAGLFVQSGYAERFERGNPAVISGISGIELARKVIDCAYPGKECPEPSFFQECSPVYWAGWALAEFQWATGRRFRDIFERIPFSEICVMYGVYHEMDIRHFVEDANQRYKSIQRETRLKILRESMGLSQAKLAELSGVKLRSIQMYEQKGNDIDKAQVRTVYRLSRVLGCTIEDLLENPNEA